MHSTAVKCLSRGVRRGRVGEFEPKNRKVGRPGSVLWVGVPHHKCHCDRFVLILGQLLKCQNASTRAPFIGAFNAHLGVQLRAQARILGLI